MLIYTLFNFKHYLSHDNLFINYLYMSNILIILYRFNIFEVLSQKTGKQNPYKK